MVTHLPSKLAEECPKDVQMPSLIKQVVALNIQLLNSLSFLESNIKYTLEEIFPPKGPKYYINVHQ